MSRVQCQTSADILETLNNPKLFLIAIYFTEKILYKLKKTTLKQPNEKNGVFSTLLDIEYTVFYFLLCYNYLKSVFLVNVKA